MSQSLISTCPEAVKAFEAEWTSLHFQLSSCIVAMKPTSLVRIPHWLPEKRSRSQLDDSSLKTELPSKRQRVEAKPQQHSPFSDFHDLGRRSLDICRIRTISDGRRRPGLPNDIVPPVVYDFLAKEAIQKWQAPLERYLKLTIDLLKSTHDRSLNENTTLLKSKTNVDLHVSKVNDVLSERIMDLFHAAAAEIFVNDQKTYQRHRDCEHGLLTRARNIERLRAVGAVDPDREFLPLIDMSSQAINLESKTMAEILSRLGPDEFDIELQVAAVVRGYYRYAACQFMDRIALSVRKELFHSHGSIDFPREAESYTDKAGI